MAAGQEGGFRSATAFHALGLWSNPFAALSHDELVDVLGVADWVAQLAEARWDLLVIVGEAGLGKSTAAHMLVRALRERGARPEYVRLDTEHAGWPRFAPSADVIIVDEAQRFGRWARRRLPSRLGGRARVVLVGQEDVTVGRVLAGTVTRITPPLADAAELASLYARLVAVAGRGAGVPSLHSDAAARLAEGTRGNRMRVVRTLYGVFEELVTVSRAGAVEVNTEMIDRGLAGLLEEERASDGFCEVPE